MRPNTGKVTASFAAVAKHYGVHVDLCRPRHGNCKGTVEKANHSAAQRWWRTLPDELTVAQAQASLDAFCARTGDTRKPKQGGEGTTVGALAALEDLAPLPPAFPAVLREQRIVASQALVAWRSNFYSVPPGLAGATMTISHRLGSTSVEVATTTGTVLARHYRESDGAGVLVRDVGPGAPSPGGPGRVRHRQAVRPQGPPTTQPGRPRPRRTPQPHPCPGRRA